MIPADTALQVVSILLYSTSSVRRIGCEESGGAVPRFWLKPWAGLLPEHRLIGKVGLPQPASPWGSRLRTDLGLISSSSSISTATSGLANT